MPRFFKMINNEKDLRKRTDEDSPYYKKRITGFKKRIHPENMKVSEINEINLLREELKLTHKTYLSKIKTLSDRADYMECRYNNLFVQFSKHRKTSRENEDELLNNLETTENEAETYFSDLMDCEKDRTGWIGRTLKFQYLFEQMKRIGLQQSEDIFECFEDIEVPEVSVKVKDRFVPTNLTDNIDPAEEDYWAEEDIIEDWVEDEPIEEGIPPEPELELERLEENIIPPQDDNQRMNYLTPIGWRGGFGRINSDNDHYVYHREEWVKCELVTDHHHDSIIKIQKVFRGYITRKRFQE